MIKSFILLATIAFSISFSASAFASETFETRCKKNDCFKSGWITKGESYTLNTVCKQGDCTKFGWSSKANDGSTYAVTCMAGGCFKEGWDSVQLDWGWHFDDQVTCKASSTGKTTDCLKYGWNVTTGYDMMGGSVTCHQNDCSKYGGYSVWRGRDSHTSCYKGDCYAKGWTLIID